MDNIATDIPSAPCRVEILDFDRDELAADLKSRLGLEPFRARQLIQWLYRRRHTSFDAMTDIAQSVRDQLAANYTVYRPKPVTIQLSKDGTRKFLFKLDDGAAVETVLIKQPKRYTLCISSQYGCAIGCKFCRTALMGLKRNLKTSEIIGQVLAVQDYVEKLRTEKTEEMIPEHFQNIVFMWMGEPPHNYDNVTRAIRLLNDGLGLNFSGRRITISSSGLVPAIEKFGTDRGDANLAISLNATTDEVRSRIIPINKKWPLEKLLGMLKNYPLKGRARVTFEYVMLKDVNDTEEDLQRLPGLIRGIPAKVNLIPYNQNAGLGWYSPERSTVARWQDQLLQKGITATIRWSKGEDIDAACGQLATAQREKLKREQAAQAGQVADTGPIAELAV